MAIFGYTLLALASAALLTLSLTNRGVQTAINWPVMRRLGKYSYGIYILHYPIFTLFYHLEIPARLGISGTGMGAHFLTSAAAAIASISLAALSFHFYESKFLRLKRYFRYDLPDSPGGPDATATPGRPAAESALYELS